MLPTSAYNLGMRGLIALLVATSAGCAGASAFAASAELEDWPPSGGPLIGVGGGLACGHLHVRVRTEIEEPLRSLVPPSSPCPHESPALVALGSPERQEDWDLHAMMRAFERASPSLSACGTGEVTVQIRRSFVSDAARRSADDINVRADRRSTAACVLEVLQELDVCPLRSVTSLDWTVRAQL